MIALALFWLAPARAVVEHHLSMQKLAVMSDSVVLCEELELGERVVEFPNGPVRSVLARCRALRVLKGALPPGEELMVNYRYVRRPARMGYTARDAAGHVTEKKPRENFPPGKALLFLSAVDAAGERHVGGAKLIQNDEVYDMAQDLGVDRLRPQEIPENSPPGACLRYGEAELIADYLKGMELLKDPSVPPQFTILRHEDPLAPTPWRALGLPLIIALAPALPIFGAYRLLRSRLPTKGTARFWIKCGACALAILIGLPAGVVAADIAVRPVRWERVRVGMTRDAVRCFVRNSERVQGEPDHELVYFPPYRTGRLRIWSMELRYDAEGKVKSAMIRYSGTFSWLVPMNQSK